jgi:hypothetical protein
MGPPPVDAYTYEKEHDYYIMSGWCSGLGLDYTRVVRFRGGGPEVIEDVAPE